MEFHSLGHLSVATGLSSATRDDYVPKPADRGNNGALLRGSTPGPTYPRDGASAPTATVRPRYIPPTAAVGTNLNRAEPAPAEALQFPEQAVPSEGHQLAKKRQTRRGGMRQRGGAQAPGNDQEEELPCGGTSASEQVAHRIAPPGTATSRELLRATDEEGEREMQFHFVWIVAWTSARGKALLRRPVVKLLR